MILYCTPGPWGPGEGRLLFDNEVDDNFFDLDTRVTDLEANPPEVNEIVNITSNGTQLTIHLDDGTTFGPFTMPYATLNMRGPFAAATVYAALDIVSEASNGIYLVLQPHTGVAPFNPARLIGGQPVYSLQVAPGPAGAAGAPGEDGDPGPTGDTGYFKIDLEAPFASRAAHDDEPPGYVFISSDGIDGLGGLSAMYIMGEGGTADWTGPFTWGGPAGAAGATGPVGPSGTNYDVDAQGVFAGRAAHDGEAAGFSYLSTNGDGGITTLLATLYFKNSGTSGDWSGGTGFEGPPGATGPAGPTGPIGPIGLPGNNADPDATGLFSGRAAHNNQAQGFIYLSTNGDGGANQDASLYIKNSNTSADWSARIPFAGPRGLTGPPGTTGAAGPAGPQGNAGAAGVGVPTGGTTGQVLAKASNTNFATEWVSPGGAVYPVETLILALSDEATAITTGVAKLTMRMPYNGDIIGLPRASLSVVSSSGLPTVDIKKGGVSILSTLLTIDASEKTSKTATAAVAVSDDNFLDDDEFTFDITVAGTGAMGLKVMLFIQRTS